MGQKALTEEQRAVMAMMTQKGGVLVADVLPLLAHRDHTVARNLLDSLVRKGLAQKKPVYLRVPTPFLLGSGSTHRQKFAKYYPAVIPPAS